MPRWLKCVGIVLAVDVAGAIAVLLGFGIYITRLAAPPFTDPNPGVTFKIVALGDSYASGEGAERFFAGTDRPGVNTCRRAPTAYPYLVAVTLKASLAFAACSGATTADIFEHGQQPTIDPDVSGGEKQIEILRRHADADVVLLSVGGNDAGFGPIGRSCTYGGDCRQNADFWLRDLDRVYGRLLNAYRAVKQAAGRAQVFVMTYPNPLGPRHCDELPISEAEQGFLRDEFVPRLNMLISFAAVVEQVRVIDLEHALDQSRICGDPATTAALNIVGPLSRTSGGEVDVLNWGHNSFHPNALGHRLMANVVTETLRKFQANSLSSMPSAPPPGIPPPPYVPSSIGVPIGPYDFPSGTTCSGDEIALVIPIAVSERHDQVTLRINDAQPDSRVCYRGYKEGWRSSKTSSSGELSLGLDASRSGFGSASEVLYLSRNNVWIKVVVSRVDVSVTATAGLDPLVIAGVIAGGIALVLLNGLAIVWCSRRARTGPA